MEITCLDITPQRSPSRSAPVLILSAKAIARWEVPRSSNNRAERTFLQGVRRHIRHTAALARSRVRKVYDANLAPRTSIFWHCPHAGPAKGHSQNLEGHGAKLATLAKNVPALFGYLPR